jgi:hypothetical protein
MSDVGAPVPVVADVVGDQSAAAEPQLRVPRTQVVMLAAAAAILVGGAVVFVDWRQWSDKQRELAHSSAFQLWLALICMQMLLWTLAAAPLVSMLRRVWRERSSARREAVPAAVVLVGLGLALLLVPREFYEVPEFIPHRAWKVNVVTGVALLVSLTAALSIWLVRDRLEHLAAAGQPTRADLQEYVRLRGQLDQLLRFLGAVVGVATLSSAAFREVVLRYGDLIGKPQEFPVELVLIYGFAVSLIVALVYLPTYASAHATGVILRDRLEPFPDPHDSGFESALSRRDKLDELLGLKVSASASFRAGVAILSPLLASLTSLLPKLGA